MKKIVIYGSSRCAPCKSNLLMAQSCAPSNVSVEYVDVFVTPTPDIHKIPMTCFISEREEISRIQGLILPTQFRKHIAALLEE